MVIYHPFVDYGIFRNISQHSMFVLPKDESGLMYNEHQENNDNSYVITFSNIQQFINYSLE